MKLEKQLKPHEQRVVDERNALAERTEKLNAFQTTDTFLSLPVADQELLKKQLELHNELLSVLEQRIARFYFAS